MDESKQGDEGLLNLSELADFQFGPAWARHGAEEPLRATSLGGAERGDGRGAPSRPEGNRRERPRGRREEGGEPFRKARPARGERRDNRRGDRPERPRRELPPPAEGFRVELRPCNSILEVFSSKILANKRAYPLLDLAHIVMADRKRYDLVFMRLEKGPMLIHSTREDGACWLTEAEALAYLWKAPWLSDFYRTEEVEVEAPKGTFTVVATCTLGDEVIGPVNWHGYQAALMSLYRSRYAHMSLDAFRSRISLTKSEEAVQAWLKDASHKTIWKPTREGAEDAVLEEARAVEEDFREHHFQQVYEVVDKVFINGSIPRNLLSPGLAAHLSILSDKTRRSPQMLIPNLCHGLARHHMPIYKWHGNHFTGPSRVRAIPADMVLADRMAAIVEWSKENSGKKVEEMFASLSGVPTGVDEASRQAAAEAHAPYVADMLWLLEQGFLVVTTDNAIWYPKGDAVPAPVSPAGSKKGKPHGRLPRQKAVPPSSVDSSTASAEPVVAPAAPTAAPSASEEPVPAPSEAPSAEGSVAAETTVEDAPAEVATADGEAPEREPESPETPSL